mmetsp:Transcript_4298/g.9649  ORF Transcript_4298/g.9649 Transcript_4298/m.9649 type:complete len:231 (-) Transcript_4298:716-1408(-)
MLRLYSCPWYEVCHGTSGLAGPRSTRGSVLLPAAPLFAVSSVGCSIAPSSAPPVPPTSRRTRNFDAGWSIESRWILSTAVMGTARTMPVRPHSMLQIVSESRMATGCSSSEWPKSSGSRTLPTTMCAVNGSTKASIIEMSDMWGSRITRGIGKKTATTAPTVGTKLSQKASAPKISHSSSPTASRMIAVTTPTTSESITLPLMYSRMSMSVRDGFSGFALRLPFRVSSSR